MYEYISGKISNLTPTYVIVDNNGMGYIVHISLFTYTKLTEKKEAFLFLHQIIREDMNAFYGFVSKEERDIFRLLITVSGVGPNTARMMLSSLSPSDITTAIMTSNVSTLKQIKGIGQKTAERILVDLRDKIGKSTGDVNIFIGSDNTKRNEALSALIMLGFSKNVAEKALDKVMADMGNEPVETIIKSTLKFL